MTRAEAANYLQSEYVHRDKKGQEAFALAVTALRETQKNKCVDVKRINFEEDGKREENVSEIINHPSHYTYGKYECIDEMLILFGKQAVIDYCKCAAYKYKYRYGHKGNPDDFVLDMQKAEWYIRKAEELQNDNN